MSADTSGSRESRPLAGEVWQEADNVLLLCIEPGVWWRDFGGTNVPWDAPLIAHPMTRLLDAKGQLVPEGRQVASHVRAAVETERERIAQEIEDIHHPDGLDEWCDHDGFSWPCPTARIDQIGGAS